MKNVLSTLSILTFLSVTLLSCDDDDMVMLSGDLRVTNTLQTAADPSMGGTGGTELPIETVFGLPEGALAASATISNSVEFPSYLDGLYDIDFSANSVRYSLVAPADHPVYSAFFRTIEASTFDRYYFDFDSPHGIESSSSDNSSVSLRVLSERRIVIEISEGFNFRPGSTFIIELN